MQKRNMPKLFETATVLTAISTSLGLAIFFILKNKLAASER
ncbi:hypothetical protein VII_001836 [Vibrio mimicus MB451]|nr:hypothetical protein VII_001836 [Vibrio mimicus MB451]